MISALWNQLDWNKTLNRETFLAEFSLFRSRFPSKVCVTVSVEHVRTYSIKNQQCVKWIQSTTPTLNNCTTTKKKKCFWWSMQPFNVLYRISLSSFFVRRSRIKRYSFCWLYSSFYGNRFKIQFNLFQQFPVNKYLPMPFTRKYEMKVRIKGYMQPNSQKIHSCNFHWICFSRSIISTPLLNLEFSLAPQCKD